MKVEEYIKSIETHIKRKLKEKTINPIIARCILLCLRKNITFSKLYEGAGIETEEEKKLYSKVKSTWDSKKYFVKDCTRVWQRILKELNLPRMRLQTLNVIVAVKEGKRKVKSVSRAALEAALAIGDHSPPK